MICRGKKKHPQHSLTVLGSERMGNEFSLNKVQVYQNTIGGSQTP